MLRRHPRGLTTRRLMERMSDHNAGKTCLVIPLTQTSYLLYDFFLKNWAGRVKRTGYALILSFSISGIDVSTDVCDFLLPASPTPVNLAVFLGKEYPCFSSMGPELEISYCRFWDLGRAVLEWMQEVGRKGDDLTMKDTSFGIEISVAAFLLVLELPNVVGSRSAAGQIFFFLAWSCYRFCFRPGAWVEGSEGPQWPCRQIRGHPKALRSSDWCHRRRGERSSQKGIFFPFLFLFAKFTYWG